MTNGKRSFNSKILKKERERLGYTFGTFSLALKQHVPSASKSVCWQWEKNKTSPSSKYLMAICSVLKKTPEFFYNIK